MPTFVSRVEFPSTAAKLIVPPEPAVIVVGAETVSLSVKLMPEAVSPHSATTVVSPLYVCAPVVSTFEQLIWAAPAEILPTPVTSPPKLTVAAVMLPTPVIVVENAAENGRSEVIDQILNPEDGGLKVIIR